MAEYIDREALHLAFDEFYFTNKKSLREVIDFVPATDAVEVVRCKDCRWGRESCGNIECFADLNVPSEYHGYDWYCPNGERRVNDDTGRI